MLTWRNDNSRSGVNSQELALAPSTVSSSTFGKLFSCPIDGYAYAQPLYVPNLSIPGNGTHNVVFVATEKDSVFAFDADARSLRSALAEKPHSRGIAAHRYSQPGYHQYRHRALRWNYRHSCDRRKHLRSVCRCRNTDHRGDQSAPIASRLYALDLATGQPIIQPAGVAIATPQGRLPYSFRRWKTNGPRLLLDNGTVYVAFGSFGGQGDYHGWLFGYDSSSLQQTGVFNVTPNAIQGGIWQSGGGPSADSNHNIFVATGDGPFDANRAVESYSHSDSFLRLGTAEGLSSRRLFHSMRSRAARTAGQDVGTSAPVLLADSAGSASQPHLLIGGSKSGSLYVVNRDNMGGLQRLSGFFSRACKPFPSAPDRFSALRCSGIIPSTSRRGMGI